MRCNWRIIVLSAAVVQFATSPALARPAMANAAFHLEYDKSSGGLTRIEAAADPAHLNFLAPAGENGAPSHFLGDLILRYRPMDTEWKSAGTWTEGMTATSGDIRTIANGSDSHSVTVAYAGASARPKGLRGLAVTETFALVGDGLVWRIRIKNASDRAIELGDLAFSLPFNTAFNKERDPDATYTRHVLRHAMIAGSNSYVFWMRPDGAGPYLLMTPGKNTGLEYHDQPEDGSGGYTAYVYALAQARDLQPNGTWNQPVSAAMLTAAGTAGDTIEISFDFHWAETYAGIRDRIIEQGGLDIRVLPGMVIPVDQNAEVSIKSAEKITAISAQYPGRTAIEEIESPIVGRKLYQIRFAKLGENNITIAWGTGKHTQLEYFVTESLATLVQKRAAFIVNHQQVRDPGKWYDGVFSLWDMKERMLRTPDDTGGLDGFMVGGSDDPDLSKAPLVAEKNLRYPDDREIAALEYYAQHFVWGKLQRTDKETPRPYAIYGVLNWKAQRESAVDELGKGRQKMWRSYDYPHLVQFYLAMYRIGRLYPEKLHELTTADYLDRAFGTAKAYFLVPYSIQMDPATGFPGFNDWSYKLGTMHEVHIGELIDALRAARRDGDADWLQAEWEKKAKYFTYDSAYPFGSEMYFDTTAFQSAHALARYGVTHTMQPDHDLWQDKNTGRWYSHPVVRPEDFERSMKRALDANIAARGWLENSYYQLGSDYRGSGLRYFLSYMAQMGGGPILDYGLNFSRDGYAYIGLGYASQLSSWALMNTGSPDSNYGYWFPGKENDGAAGWAYSDRKFGETVFGTKIVQGRGAWRYDGEIDNGFSEAINTACTVVVDDPIFGLSAYGGSVASDGGALRIFSRDEVRQKLFIRTKKLSVDLHLERDGFAEDAPVIIAEEAHHIEFRVENRDRSDHDTVVDISGLGPGLYRIAWNSGTALRRAGDGDFSMPVHVSTDHDNRVWIDRLSGIQ